MSEANQINTKADALLKRFYACQNHSPEIYGLLCDAADVSAHWLAYQTEVAALRKENAELRSQVDILRRGGC